jgi:hypothetical protein
MLRQNISYKVSAIEHLTVGPWNLHICKWYLLINTFNQIKLAWQEPDQEERLLGASPLSDYRQFKHQDKHQMNKSKNSAVKNNIA